MSQLPLFNLATKFSSKELLITYIIMVFICIKHVDNKLLATCQSRFPATRKVRSHQLNDERKLSSTTPPSLPPFPLPPPPPQKGTSTSFRSITTTLRDQILSRDLRLDSCSKMTRYRGRGLRLWLRLGPEIKFLCKTSLILLLKLLFSIAITILFVKFFVCRLFTVPYFSLRLPKSSALRYGQPSSWMSVKTALGDGGGK